ncbi:MAG TPA: stage V sporulation protein AE [Firmicutes bacterium]|nr:stage V sporulation protein AE [Bacillota bacterium]
MNKKKIITITDGDKVARKTIEKAGAKLGLRTISSSAGNPTPLSAEELKQKIIEAPQDLFLVMVDDAGERKKGSGESILETFKQDERFSVLGVVAVASNTDQVEGVPVNFSITREGKIHQGPVDKEGNPETEGRSKLKGDTVDILNGLKIPLIVGIGDIGKMGQADDYEQGANITTRAIKEILNFHGLSK